MKRLIIPGLLLLLVLSPAFAMGGKEKIKDPGEAINIRAAAIKGPSGIGMIHMFEDSPVLPGNATLSLEAIAAADAVTAKIMSGELDAAVLPVNVAAKLYNAGLDYRLVAVIGNGMVSVISTDPSVTGIQDLKGKDVYIAGQGATPDYLFQKVIGNAGLDKDKDLRLVYSMPIPEIAASISAGIIETAVLPEPFATIAKAGNPTAREAFSLKALWAQATGLADYPMTAFVVKGSLIDSHPDVVRAILVAIEDSIQKVLADPAAAGQLVEKHEFGLKAPIATKAIPVSAYVYMEAGKARGMLEGLLSVFLAQAPQSIGGRLPDSRFYAGL